MKIDDLMQKHEVISAMAYQAVPSQQVPSQPVQRSGSTRPEKTYGFVVR